MASLRGKLGRWLGSALEMALGFVFMEGHAMAFLFEAGRTLKLI
jgi:hypothetical protein